MQNTVFYLSKWKYGLIGGILCLLSFGLYDPDFSVLSYIILIPAILCLLIVICPARKAFVIDDKALYIYFPLQFDFSILFNPHATYVYIPKSNIKRIELTDDFYFRQTVRYYRRCNPFVDVLQITVINPSQVVRYTPSGPSKVFFDKDVEEYRISFARMEILNLSYQKFVKKLQQIIFENTKNS